MRKKTIITIIICCIFSLICALPSFAYTGKLVEYSIDEIGVKISLPEEYHVYTLDGEGDEEFIKQSLWSKEVLLENMMANYTYLTCFSEDKTKQITVVAQELEDGDNELEQDDETLLSQFVEPYRLMFEQDGGTVLVSEIYRTANHRFIKFVVNIPRNGLDNYVAQYMTYGEGYLYMLQLTSIINAISEVDNDMMDQVVDSFTLESDKEVETTENIIQDNSVNEEGIIEGIYVSQIDGTEYIFHNDGTLLCEGQEGKYFINNDQITIIANGLANKYTYEFLEDLLILYDGSGQGTVFSKSTEQNADYQNELFDHDDLNNSLSSGTGADYHESKTSDSKLTPLDAYTGKLIIRTTRERIAPLKINTTGSDIYYIYLHNVNNADNADISFLVIGGDEYEIDVPTGTYEIYYGTGPTWYGMKNKFGDEGRYYRCEGEYYFYTKGDTVKGLELTLYNVLGGNMETEEIDSSGFPG